MKNICIMISIIVICVTLIIVVITSTFISKSGEDKVEIEKKWLIDAEKIPYDLTKADKFKIDQTYISFEPEIRVRRINDGEIYTMTVKNNLTSNGLKRDEYEIDITESEYNLLVVKREGNTIHKTRYQLEDNKTVIAIDIFSDELKGLAYMEIEFESEKEAKKYKTPEWVVSDVTDDVRYKNGHLARYGIPKEENQ